MDFIRGGQSPDVRSIVPSVSLRIVENWYKAPVRILASLFQGWAMASSASFCATELGTREGRGLKYGACAPRFPLPMMSGQDNHSVVSLSSTVRPCSPWGRWIGHWRTTWPAVCSSAPHSQAAEGAIPHLHKHERKRPTPVWMRFSRTQAVRGAARNFVLGGLITWCTFYCCFRLFPNYWKWI